jgi:hypothetical protein
MLLGECETMSKLAQELAAFPFRKFRPAAFRLEIAGLTPQQLDERIVRTWVQTQDIPKMLKALGSAKVIRSFPHLDYVFLEASASQLIGLDAIEAVTAIWNDTVSRADNSVVNQSNQSPRLVAAGTHR